MSGLVLSPAHATTFPNGNYLCSTGVQTTTDTPIGTPTYTIYVDAVLGGGSCAGAVVIPIGVTSIGDNAFEDAALTSITIPASVTTIGDSAFHRTTALESIAIPASVTSIGASAFNQAFALESIAIPASVTTIGEAAFSGAVALTSITIPASVTSIGASAFYGTTALTTVTFGSDSQLTSIGFGTFYAATALTTVTFGSGSQLATIGDSAFYAATALTSITIPASVTSIGDSAFYGATALESIAIPASVTTIGYNTFALATALTTVTFGSDSQLATIGDSAFYGATALTSIFIPAGVTSIGEGAFYSATSLTSITAAGANLNYSSVLGVLFDKNATTLIEYPAGKSETSYTIPATVASIGDGAFYEATSLTSITIPATVASIGDYAFTGATALTSVYFLGNAPTYVGADGFALVADGARAYIKSGATGFDLDTDGDENSGVWYGLVVTIGVYTVTYNTSGGSAVTAQNYGANIATPTSPTRTGYTFAGWSATAGGSAITFPHTPASGSDVTLYAKWTRNLVKAKATVKPTVSGTAKVSKTLKAKKGTWTGYPTPSPTAFKYQWYSCSKTVTAAKATVPSTCKKITGATKSTLKLAKAQKGKFISVLVTGKGSGTSATKWLSKSTAIVK